MWKRTLVPFFKKKSIRISAPGIYIFFLACGQEVVVRMEGGGGGGGG